METTYYLKEKKARITCDYTGWWVFMTRSIRERFPGDVCERREEQEWDRQGKGISDGVQEVQRPRYKRE